VPEPAQHTERPVTVPDMRAVRIALLVGMGVVLAVVGHPAHHRTLHGHRADNRERILERLRNLE
jgi:hypothetical protein